MSLVLNNPQNIPHFSLGLSDSRETGSGGRSGGEGGRVWGLGTGGGREKGRKVREEGRNREGDEGR